MIKIPYGISDFRGLIAGDYFYQDRTEFIEKLEKWSANYPIFLRPHGFGKSLFVSTLQHYYGLEYKENFQSLFGKLYIGQQPTQLANSYMVLRFEFSGIDIATYESIYQGFLNKVKLGVRQFVLAYSPFFTSKEIDSIEACKTPESVLSELLICVEQNKIPHKIYVLIDDYDHFSFDLKRFFNRVNRGRFVPQFYETLKFATGTGRVGRIFITGTSPISLDALSSGFNIGSHITTNPIFQDMMGFTHTEVETVLNKLAISNDILPNLAEWYGGYRFATAAQNSLFNTNLLIGFLNQYNITGEYSEMFLDYQEGIRNIFQSDNKEEENMIIELLEELKQKGYIDFSLTRLFNLEFNFSDTDFLSLLFYKGILSFRQKKLVGWRCAIPNYAVKRQLDIFAN